MLVDAVGAGVDGLAVGDRVWLVLAQQRAGRTARRRSTPCSPRRTSRRCPTARPTTWAPRLGVPAVTAHRALTSGEVGPSRLGPGALDGMTVLVAGGAGAVGNAAIQLARWSGATVVTTVSGPRRRSWPRPRVRTTS